MEKKTVNSKEQHEIILKLYNGLCKNLKIINQKFEKNADDNEISQLAFKADKITAALQSCLDFDNKDTKKISENLREIYRHIRLSMKLIYESKNFELLKSSSDISSTLKDSWSQIKSKILWLF